MFMVNSFLHSKDFTAIFVFFTYSHALFAVTHQNILSKSLLDDNFPDRLTYIIIKLKCPFDSLPIFIGFN